VKPEPAPTRAKPLPLSTFEEKKKEGSTITLLVHTTSVSGTTTIQKQPETMKPSSSKVVYLMTGDIGGTNSRMSLYPLPSSSSSAQQSSNNPTTSIPSHLHYHEYRNEEELPKSCRTDPHAFATRIVAPFLQECFERLGILPEDTTSYDEHVEIVACIATAGIVTNNAAKLTNLDNLQIDGNDIVSNPTHNPYLTCVKRVMVINDFVAQGYGCLTLQSSEVQHLYGPHIPPEQLLSGPKVCVGAGTGLGECYLTPQESSSSSTSLSSYTCFPSEGGHVEYAPRNDEEVALWKYLSHKFTSHHRISVERVVSGIGLANVYEYLATTYPQRIDTTVHTTFVKAKDEKGRVVAENATTPQSLCEQAMHIMMAAYGCEVGSAAIKWIPTGGLFVTGGLTPKNIHFIQGQDTEFIKAYRNKGRVTKILDMVPCYAVMVQDLGVRGAYFVAQTEYQRLQEQDGGGSSSSSSSWWTEVWFTATVTAALGFLAGSVASKVWK
jgi:glucokinase